MLKGVCDCCNLYRDNVRLLKVQGFDLGYVCFDCFSEMMSMCNDLRDKLNKNEDLTITIKFKDGEV